MKRAVIYARVSSVTDRQSTDRQVKDLTSFACKEGLNIAKTFEEHISGAKRNEERPVLNECIEYCTSNEIDYLLLSELSRLGRNTLQVLKSLETLHANGICVYIQNLNLYTLLGDGQPNPITSIIVTIMAEMASIERTGIVYRLQSGRAAHIAKGGRIGRNKGSNKTREQKEEQYSGVIRRLKRGEKIRDIAKLEGVGVSTVQRLKKEFNL